MTDTTTPTSTIITVPVRHLRAGDIIGTGETILNVWADSTTMKGKRKVHLETADGSVVRQWNAGTVMRVRRG
jgi:hypothetical protein